MAGFSPSNSWTGRLTSISACWLTPPDHHLDLEPLHAAKLITGQGVCRQASRYENSSRWKMDVFNDEWALAEGSRMFMSVPKPYHAAFGQGAHLQRKVLRPAEKPTTTSS